MEELCTRLAKEGILTWESVVTVSEAICSTRLPFEFTCKNCLAPFQKVEFDHDGTIYKYCLYIGSELVDSCTAETECENMDSYLALLEGFPDKTATPLIHSTIGKHKILL